MIDEIIRHLEEKAIEYGAKNKDEYSKDYVLRKNIKSDAFRSNGAFFGFIHPEEEASGTYHDLSYVVFPSESDDCWVVCLGIGSLGFKNDLELASTPGLRRLFSSIINREKSFCKTDFSDIETSLAKSFLQNEQITPIRRTLEVYKKVLPVCQIIDKPTLEAESESIQTLEAFLAAYASIRNWASNANHRKAIAKVLNKVNRFETPNNKDEIKKILMLRKYIVLEGAPGTGKTRMAQIITDEPNSKVFFTQFHAETTYSDFIWGLRPKLNEERIVYEEVKGEFVKAIEYARREENLDKDVYLIVDEINRANLSNILGPIFYLFEYQRSESRLEVEITPDLNIRVLPKNLYVIATMNTADRSLAVVDFALRRRFAWITMKPAKIENQELADGYKFFEEDYVAFDKIFQWYASSSELNLQPGQAFFIAKNDDENLARIAYELFPLIKEYLQEGLLLAAREDFDSYFQSKLGKSLFE